MNATRSSASGPVHARKKFLRYFPDGFRDETYIDWERGYKWRAHEQWSEVLDAPTFKNLLQQKRFAEVSAEAIRIESRTNLLFSFEKMALRDAVRSRAGAELFATALYDFLHGNKADHTRFASWCKAVERLPRRQTRVLTWPLVTVWGFIAQPERHFSLKPNVTRIAAERYGVAFAYQSKPNWETYAQVLNLAATVRRDVRDLRPRDMIDIQSFLWVQGSDEYPD